MTDERQMTTDSAGAADRKPHVSLWEIFRLFFSVGLLSFGGGLTGWLYREVVLQREWIGRNEFFSGVTFGQIMPGTNISNLTIFIGQHLRGLAGAIVALTALLIGPFFAVIALYLSYDAAAGIDWLQDALDGVAAAALGLLLLLGGDAARNASRGLATVLALVATFVAVGVLQWPMVPVVIGVAIPSVIWAAIRRRP